MGQTPQHSILARFLGFKGLLEESLLADLIKRRGTVRENQYESLKHIFEELFCGMSDFNIRELNFPNAKFAVIYISNHSSKEMINKFVITPISEAYLRGGAENPIEDIVVNSGFSSAKSIDEAREAVLAGNSLLIFETMGAAFFGYICATRNEEGRGNEEPQTENVIRGAHDGFNESAEQSAMLIRRRIKSEKLKSEKMTIGSLTKTDVIIMYISDIVNTSALEILRKRLSDMKTDAVIDSGSVEMYIQDGKNALYPTVGNSERPDKVAAKILEGRIAVIVDGSPVVLTVPYLFCEGIQVSEDYWKSSFYASFMRILRFVSFALTIYLPSFFVAVMMYHESLLPEGMLLYIKASRENIGFSVFWEVIVAFLIFEILREVGLRMPKSVGSAMGIVGSLILGESAVEAGIVSPFVLILVAFCAVCNFIAAPYMNPNTIYRFMLIVFAGAAGLFGVFAAIAVSLLVICSKTSFGVPYFAPLAPMSAEGLRDFLYMAPIWRMKKVPPSVSGRNIIRTEGKK